MRPNRAVRSPRVDEYRDPAAPGLMGRVPRRHQCAARSVLRVFGGVKAQVDWVILTTEHARTHCCKCRGRRSGLPLTMRVRLDAVVSRLEKWRAVSGAKPLRGELKGHVRIRMGDWRVIFKVIAPDLIIVRVAHRSTVYEE
jgi:mRNA-degrading endonuclease RelE of RelBE toxin-antitoxin system